MLESSESYADLLIIFVYNYVASNMPTAKTSIYKFGSRNCINIIISGIFLYRALIKVLHKKVYPFFVTFT